MSVFSDNNIININYKNNSVSRRMSHKGRMIKTASLQAIMCNIKRIKLLQAINEFWSLHTL